MVDYYHDHVAVDVSSSEPLLQRKKTKSLRRVCDSFFFNL